MYGDYYSDQCFGLNIDLYAVTSAAAFVNDFHFMINGNRNVVFTCLALAKPRSISYNPGLLLACPVNANGFFTVIFFHCNN